MKFFLITFLSFGLIGCANLTGVDPTNYTAVSNGISIKNDPYKDTIHYAAPSVIRMHETYHLRATKITPESKTPEVIQLYVRASMSDWAFFDRAYAGGQRYDVTVIDREIGSCSQYGCLNSETVGVNFTIDNLVTFSKTGLDIKIEGDKGQLILEIPSQYFLAFHSSLEH